MNPKITQMIVSVLIAVALCVVSFSARALNSTDVGVYSVVHVDGHVTDKKFRLLRSERGWSVEEERPDGTWEDITCMPGCAMVESSLSDVERFLGHEALDEAGECIHNQAFAFCRVTSKALPAQRNYLFVALTQKKPIALRLARIEQKNPGWNDQQGNVVPNTESRASVDGFAGSLLVTPDADWREKWDTPSNTTPHFNEAKVVAKGKKIFLLTFFSNPQLSDDGRADVLCDIDIVRPDGRTSSHQMDLVCFQGKIAGNPNNIYLSSPVVAFSGDPDDPVGVWVVRVALKDQHRHVVLPLRSSFTLQ